MKLTFFNQCYSNLTKYLTEENIKNANLVFENKLSTNSTHYQDKSHWYAISYPVIVSFFEETRFEQTESDWIKRLSMIGSWLPTIINPTLSAEAIDDLKWLEEHFHHVKLEEIGEESYLGNVGTNDHGQRIFSTINNLPPVLIKDFVKATHRITSTTDYFDGNLSTTTKILHFMHPHLFPIYDLKIHNLLFKGKQSYGKYHTYIFALRQWLEDHKESILLVLKEIAAQHEVSVIRFVDYTLFNLKRDDDNATDSKL